jgi:hypothetical protein
MFSNFFPKIFAVYEIMSKNLVDPEAEMTIWRMSLACQITKATHTHSQYKIFIAFPQQKYFRERASILRYTHIATLVRS